MFFSDPNTLTSAIEQRMQERNQAVEAYRFEQESGVVKGRNWLLSQYSNSAKKKVRNLA